MFKEDSPRVTAPRRVPEGATGSQRAKSRQYESNGGHDGGGCEHGRQRQENDEVENLDNREAKNKNE